MSFSIKFANTPEQVTRALQSTGDTKIVSEDPMITEFKIEELAIPAGEGNGSKEGYLVIDDDINVIDVMRAVMKTRLTLAEPAEVAKALQQETHKLMMRVFKHVSSQ